MSRLGIRLSRDRTQFLPGDTVSGTVFWELDEEPMAAEVRLFWYTQGKGTQDICITDTTLFQNPTRASELPFEVMLPEMPYSFSGKLVSLVWALELVIEPGTLTARQEITMSPTGNEILLYGSHQT